MLDLFDELAIADDRVEAVRVADLQREAATRSNVARFTRAMWIAAVLLLLFNSQGLVTYVNGWGVGPVQDTVVALATTWNDQMEKNGLTRPAALVRSAIERWRNSSWNEVRAMVAPPAPRESAIELRGARG